MTELRNKQSGEVSNQAGNRSGIALLWLGLVLLAHAPLLIRFGLEQWGRPQYQFFPIILVAAMALAWRRLSEVGPEELRAGTRWVADALAATALVLFLLAGMFWASRGAAISCWVAVVAIAYRCGGRGALRALAPALILLALVTGPPAGYDVWFLQKLRELAVSIADGVLVLLNVPHLMAGTIIEVPNARLLVAEACSGINSLMAVIGCTLVLAFWRRRGPAAIAVLLVAGVLAVLWANVVRIAGGAWLKASWDIDILTGDVHQFTSIVLFSVCILLVLCTDGAIAMLDWVFRAPAPAEEADAQAAVPTAPVILPRGAVPLEFWGIAAVALAASALFLVHAHQNGGIPKWIASPSVSHLPPDAVFEAPKQIGPWQRSADAEKVILRPEIEGMRSQVWAYKNGDTTVILALDYPFPGFHDLTVCYRNTGWMVLRDIPLTQEAGKGGKGFYNVTELARVHERGYLWYSSLNEEGIWMQPPEQSSSGRLWSRMSALGWPVCTYQVQLLYQAYDDLPEQQRADLAQLFLAFREDMARQITAQLRGAQ